MDTNEATEISPNFTIEYDYEMSESFDKYNYYDLIPTAVVYGLCF
jgi:hypothetical protein